MADLPFVVLPSAGGRAGVGGVAAEVVVDLLPGLLLGAAVVAANLLHLLEEQVQVDCKRETEQKNNDNICTETKIDLLKMCDSSIHQLNRGQHPKSPCLVSPGPIS